MLDVENELNIYIILIPFLLYIYHTLDSYSFTLLVMPHPLLTVVQLY